MTLAIEAGMASYVGVGAAVTADGAGSEAARAAAIDVAAIFFFNLFERKRVNATLGSHAYFLLDFTSPEQCSHVPTKWGSKSEPAMHECHINKWNLERNP